MSRINPDVHKLHPWLRVIRNGSKRVNAVRSDGSTKVASRETIKAVGTAAVHEQMPIQADLLPHWSESVSPVEGKLQNRGHRSARNSSTNAYVNVFIELYPEPDRKPGASRRKKPSEMQRLQKKLEKEQKSAKGIPAATILRRNIISATIPVSMLDTLDRDPAIAFVHPAEALKLERPTTTALRARPTDKAIGSASRHGRGKGLIIGIIDVDGFDFAHRDFLRNGKTRFVAIWDQGGVSRKPPAKFGYGAEILKSHMDSAIAAAGKEGLPQATLIETQSQRVVGSHGTHVASIAAGNSGVCPQADIAAVLIDVPPIEQERQRRRATFSDTSRITHAVEYLLSVAEQANRPISINISLGTNGGSHDGASGVSRWLDAYLATPGRAICVAAGNAGQERSLEEGDLGFVMGRIHSSGVVPSRGLEVELGWTIIGDGFSDVSENELEIWYGAQDRFAVSIKPPGNSEWITVKPGEFVENRRLSKQGIFVSVYNELYHPTTGGNYIAVYLSPNLDPEKFKGITPGVWRVRIIGEEVRDGRFDAWIERDDPMEIGRDGTTRVFRFPSFFTETTNVDSHSITSLACGHRVIAVANLDEARERINASSSQGPTRDGRCKPEIAAPGTDIVAANGFADSSAPYIAMTGTSMASPHVAGVVGLMLAANDKLTAAQCLGILQRTARPLAGASYKWLNDMGFGRINATAAVEEAKAITTRIDISEVRR